MKAGLAVALVLLSSASPIVAQAGWTRLTPTTSEMTDATTTGFVIRADHGAAGILHELPPPELTIACQERKVYVVVGFQTPITSSRDVTIRFDKDPAMPHPWSAASGDPKAVVGVVTPAVLKKFTSATLLRVEFTPMTGSATVVHFPIATARPNFSAFQGSCATGRLK